MMRKVLKGVGFALVGLIAVALFFALGLYISTNFRLNKTYDPVLTTVTLPTNPSSIDKGHHKYVVHCAGCHGMDLAGGVVFSDPQLGTIAAPKIAAGFGEGGRALSDEDLVRAIRYGVGPDKKPLLVMPAEAFSYMSDQDLGAIIAYIKSVPQSDAPPPQMVMKPLGLILIGAGAFGKVIPAEEIARNSRQPLDVPAGITVEYGNYLVRTGECRTCHGSELSGGKDPNPNAPPAPNLTRGGEMIGWSEQDFINTLRTGKTPGGHQLTEFMPWKFIGQMTDAELKAMWLYLQSLPASPTTK